MIARFQDTAWPIVHTFSAALSILLASHFCGPDATEDDRRTFQISELVAHRDVMRALLKLSEHVNPKSQLARQVELVTEAYKLEVKGFIYDFEAVIRQNEIMTVWADFERMREARPRIMAWLAKFMHDVTATVVRSPNVPTTS